MEVTKECCLPPPKYRNGKPRPTANSLSNRESKKFENYLFNVFIKIIGRVTDTIINRFDSIAFSRDIHLYKLKVFKTVSE